ncbi:hypothetical protein ABH920_005921 [Catenulispora sp. EB89]
MDRPVRADRRIHTARTAQPARQRRTAATGARRPPATNAPLRHRITASPHHRIWCPPARTRHRIYLRDPHRTTAPLASCPAATRRTTETSRPSAAPLRRRSRNMPTPPHSASRRLRPPAALRTQPVHRRAQPPHEMPPHLPSRSASHHGAARQQPSAPSLCTAAHSHPAKCHHICLRDPQLTATPPASSPPRSTYAPPRKRPPPPARAAEPSRSATDSQPTAVVLRTGRRSRLWA